VQELSAWAEEHSPARTALRHLEHYDQVDSWSPADERRDA
jgi:hypothetical protein